MSLRVRVVRTRPLIYFNDFSKNTYFNCLGMFLFFLKSNLLRIELAAFFMFSCVHDLMTTTTTISIHRIEV